MGKSKTMDWKEVKLSGNLLTDDSVGMLDGLIGLEVLENYDKTMVQKIKTKRPKRKKNEAPLQSNKKSSSSGDGSDEDEAGPAKKKAKKKQKKPSEPEEEEEVEETETHQAGRFVMAPVDSESIDYSQSLPEWQYYNLQNVLLEAILENGFTKPTEIQRLVLAPAILGRRDILGAAETGSGKTLAFGLPILNGILHLKKQLAANETLSIRKGSEFNTFFSKGSFYISHFPLSSQIRSN